MTLNTFKGTIAREKYVFWAHDILLFYFNFKCYFFIFKYVRSVLVYFTLVSIWQHVNCFLQPESSLQPPDLPYTVNHTPYTPTVHQRFKFLCDKPVNSAKQSSRVSEPEPGYLEEPELSLFFHGSGFNFSFAIPVNCKNCTLHNLFW